MSANPSLDDLSVAMADARDQIDTVLHALRENGETLEFGRSGLIFLLDTASATLDEMSTRLAARTVDHAAAYATADPPTCP